MTRPVLVLHSTPCQSQQSEPSTSTQLFRLLKRLKRGLSCNRATLSGSLHASLQHHLHPSNNNKANITTILKDNHLGSIISSIIFNSLSIATISSNHMIITNLSSSLIYIDSDSSLC